MTRPRIGVSVYGLPASDFLDLAVAADEVGFDALWLGEHILLPVGYESEHPTVEAEDAHQEFARPVGELDTVMLDPFVALSAAAALTSRVRLATGIFVLPLRHPLAAARTACTLQQIAGDRFLFGVGIGWAKEEFASLGVDMSGRGTRFEEAIELMRLAWSGGPFEFRGTAYATDGLVQITPDSVKIPLVLGGNTPHALARAALLGDAWFSSGTPSFEQAQKLRDELLRIRAEHDQSAEYRCYVRIAGADPDIVGRYAAAGFDDLTVWSSQVWHGDSLDEKRKRLRVIAQSLGLKEHLPQ